MTGCKRRHARLIVIDGWVAVDSGSGFVFGSTVGVGFGLVSVGNSVVGVVVVVADSCQNSVLGTFLGPVVRTECGRCDSDSDSGSCCDRSLGFCLSGVGWDVG